MPSSEPFFGRSPGRSDWRPTNDADEGTGAFVGEFGGGALVMWHIGVGTGCAILIARRRGQLLDVK